MLIALDIYSARPYEPGLFDVTGYILSLLISKGLKTPQTASL